MATISLHNFWSPLLGILNSLCKKCCVACRFWWAREDCLPCSELGPINGSPKVRQTHDLVVVSCSPPATSPGVLDKSYNWAECHKSLIWKGKHTSTNIHFNQTLEVTKLGTQYLSAQEMWRFLDFASQTKHALENSFPNTKNASTFRAVFSSRRHSYTSIPPFHLSTWLMENRQAIKNTSTSNHGDNVAHYSLALSQRFWHSSGRKRRGEDKNWNRG